MPSTRLAASLGLVAAIILVAPSAGGQPYSEGEEYLGWASSRAKAIGLAMRSPGRVGAFFDFRVRHTEKSYNYKLRATWLTPEVIRAGARLKQLREGLSEGQARALVADAEAAADTVVQVEIDPREGSGVIPLDWVAFLGPKGLPSEAPGRVRGVSDPKLRNLPALAGVVERDYDYDVFWVPFALRREGGTPLFEDSTAEAELIVRVHEKEGRVAWPIPPSMRQRIKKLMERQ